MTLTRAHVVVRGRVQGVWFRGWTKDQADRRGLSGWVRNRQDGSVEALFSGPARVVADMMEACWAGPPAARVSKVTPVPDAPPQDRGFRTLPTR